VSTAIPLPVESCVLLPLRIEIGRASCGPTEYEATSDFSGEKAYNTVLAALASLHCGRAGMVDEVLVGEHPSK